MNNVDDFYKREQLLKIVEESSHHHNSFFFRIHTEARAVRVVLEGNLVNNLEGNEQKRVLEIIRTGLSSQEKRHEIEDYLIDELKRRLEESRKQVQKDFRLDDKEEVGLSDPRD